MSRRTTIAPRAVPGPTASMAIPSAWAAKSRAYIASLTRAATASASASATPSAPREAGRGLLEEGGDALLVVAAPPGRALQVALEVELRVERVARARVDRPLDEPERRGRPVGEKAHEPARLGHQPLVVDHLPDE